MSREFKTHSAPGAKRSAFKLVVAPKPAQKAATATPDAQGKVVEVEVGGPKGPEPTRFGDWEVGGRCVDF